MEVILDECDNYAFYRKDRKTKRCICSNYYYNLLYTAKANPLDTVVDADADADIDADAVADFLLH